MKGVRFGQSFNLNSQFWEAVESQKFGIGKQLFPPGKPGGSHSSPKPPAQAELCIHFNPFPNVLQDAECLTP